MRLGAPVHTLARIPCLMPPLGPALFPAGGLTPPRSGRCKLERNKGNGLSGGGAHGDPARRGWLVVPDAVLGPWPESGPSTVGMEDVGWRSVARGDMMLTLQSPSRFGHLKALGWM